jgi:1-aminocyclopropane-1-carboxylate deaminase|nr:pyridoxal-phosphate dependent enzyme [uncultured Flavobacterium sp.]
MPDIFKINLPNTSDVNLFIKREDLVHPIISGNKFRKLKYNLEEAKNQNHHTLLTFGGAFSNHIVAVAGAGKEFGFQTIGIIRGEELASKIEDNPSLSLAASLGMQFKFVDRTTYRNKTDESFTAKLSNEFGPFYLIPEGGTNSLAVKGCEEILSDETKIFDYICVAVGTGGTISGIINASQLHQKIIGFSSLKGDFLTNDISKFVSKSNWYINCEYHFGGYGKVSDELISFINQFYSEQQIPLDPIYTGKMMFGVMDMIEKKQFPKGSKILVIHTGGLQGIEGMNRKLQASNKTIVVK